MFWMHQSYVLLCCVICIYSIIWHYMPLYAIVVLGSCSPLSWLCTLVVFRTTLVWQQNMVFFPGEIVAGETSFGACHQTGAQPEEQVPWVAHTTEDPRGLGREQRASPGAAVHLRALQLGCRSQWLMWWKWWMNMALFKIAMSEWFIYILYYTILYNTILYNVR